MCTLWITVQEQDEEQLVEEIQRVRQPVLDIYIQNLL